MARVKFLIGLTIVGLVVLITLQNVAPVETSLLLWTFELPRAVLIFAVFVFGFVVGQMFSFANR